jgi:hypothetical protein
MADWGPIHKPESHGKTVAREEGAVIQPHVRGGSTPNHSENYDATDGRHNRADHQGWESVDRMGGIVSGTDWEHPSSRFPDGPGPWRQT